MTLRLIFIAFLLGVYRAGIDASGSRMLGIYKDESDTEPAKNR